ncbi:MAG: 16S rRNA (cytosine(1402)-N(4))-methyltransferase RsmH [Pseudodesulfovibrio sp.]|uniref:Ribosomal RNA small subunit methyltransferase H n=1 Tax=Pseudodesulfovibrio aespoeensis (strain ATCC 700646 / DSM 10631 / Aspo-2) TaxID=643562 RepID=E6VXF2_PSEA9|nr:MULTISPECIES: 16S rRNA (cytosine(1402)-N(4))-methyltransferase RsmH [Pseudodesulfovibrio]MBU4191575.1 16S rRNA (cytosine(1402)-N(4))-methyltransferase RsmH [Pseudomonadota bacterium]ADU63768.1 S-adenosyl-methyltransferase MraW [Pseudodesulfovibrio aespoeensis Aspo-2]MBU4244828.1 16S rRNA (cytosine(1402)-N(4))-methyltransferase RsmH [Pseudomonadota bacterium]MBU4379704.1 16S rRNA (cytosine(1402)-N(4))-methyltransferase RsmH [Pseudomonadota bacterium]MBU4475684.1 16S rRNA (cytosine(1402)-N(4)
MDGRLDPGSIHTTVLLHEVIEWLRPKPGGRYLDGTLGMGGHSHALLERAGQGAELAGLDRDAQALALAGERLAGMGDRAHLFRLPFSRFEEALDALGWETVDGAVLDLGVSSLQLDEAERGFSFLSDGPLDMRMDPDCGPSAADLVNTLKHGDLARIIRTWGEDPLAGKIASAILRARDKEAIMRTLRLAEIVRLAYPPKMRHTARNHPATRTFQGLRIAVNREAEELEHYLQAIVGRLAPGARLAIISFHSLEDRAVKRAFLADAKGCHCPPHQMHCTCNGVPSLKVLTRKPLIPSDDEMARNPRSRSAKLRVAERLGPDGEEA